MRRELVPYLIYATVAARQMECITRRGEIVTIRNYPLASKLGLNPSRLGIYLSLLVEIGLISDLVRSRGVSSFKLNYIRT